MLYVDSVSVESKIVIPKFLDPPSLNDAPLFPFYKQMQKRRDNPFSLTLRHAIQTQD